jgi:hypothetical protein
MGYSWDQILNPNQGAEDILGKTFGADSVPKKLMQATNPNAPLAVGMGLGPEKSAANTAQMPGSRTYMPGIPRL